MGNLLGKRGKCQLLFLKRKGAILRIGSRFLVFVCEEETMGLTTELERKYLVIIRGSLSPPSALETPSPREGKPTKSPLAEKTPTEIGKTKARVYSGK